MPLRSTHVVCVFGLLFLVVREATAQGGASPPSIPAHSLQGLLNDLAARVNIAAGQPADPSAEVNIIGVLAGLEVSTAPIGTSTGGFTYIFDARLGTFSRSTQSFGPAFSKRSLTIGKGKVSTGFNWLHASYDSLAGFDLDNWDLRPVKNARTPDGSLAPVFYSAAKLEITADTYVGVVSYGVTNDLDIGVAVPFVRMAVAGTVGFFTPTDEDVTPGGHYLEMPRATASGIGDLLLFGKYHFLRRGDGGLAAEVEWRFPTGDINSLRGIGIHRSLVSAIWSHGGSVSPHANVGYEIWSDKVVLDPSLGAFVKDQISYGFGVEIRAHPRATVIMDIVGRRQLHGGKIAYLSLGDATGSSDSLQTLPGGLDIVSFAPGLKWNAAGNVLLTANVLASLANQGLRARIIPFVGFEWAF